MKLPSLNLSLIAFRLKYWILAVLTTHLLFLSSTVYAAIITESDYFEFSDSPFASVSFSLFYLEDFENYNLADDTFNTPGVSTTTGLFRIDDSLYNSVDSVDADDGLIDGSGSNGGSGYNYGYMEFLFSASELGALPTHVGLVWTDGTPGRNVTFSAYDNTNSLIGSHTQALGNGNFYGNTAEDFFFGAVNAAGISRITLYDNGGINDMEIDHLQYGIEGVATVHEPGNRFMFIGAIVLLVLSRLSRYFFKTNRHRKQGTRQTETPPNNPD